MNPIGPRACYDEGKRVSETLAYAYEKQEGLSIRVARIFNTYGPRMHMKDGRVVSNFILQALKNEPITVYGNGKQTRSFQYVDDLVNGLVVLMNSNFTQPVNFGNPQGERDEILRYEFYANFVYIFAEHTIEEFAEIIQKLVGGDSKIQKLAAVEDDPQRRRPDISRAKKILDWEPKVSLQDGLKKTLEHFRDEIRKENVVS